jgi:DNA polymerase delta subunit 1
VEHSSIVKFAVKRRTCLGCNYPLADGERAVCKNCKPQEGALYVQQIERAREHEALFARVWAQCQRCQGSLHQDVLCTSRDCPIFYRRKKVQKDLREAQEALERFKF